MRPPQSPRSRPSPKLPPIRGADTLGSGRATYDIAGSVYAPGSPCQLPGINLDDFGGKSGTAGVELGYNHRVGDKLVFGVQLGRASSAIDTDAALNLSPILPLDLTYRYRAKSATSLGPRWLSRQ